MKKSPSKSPQPYSTHLHQFRQSLQSALRKSSEEGPGALARALYASNGRTPLFYLQGLTRMDRRIGEDRYRAEKERIHFKTLEDRLGQYDYWADLERRSNEAGLPAPFSRYFRDHAHAVLGALEDRLQSSGWLSPGENPGSIFQDLEAPRDSVSSKKDRKRLARFISGELLKIDTRLRSQELDLSEVENGIHELRRKLRWISIYGHALLGRIQIAPSTRGEPFEEFITPALKRHPYNRFANPQKQEPEILYPAGAFYALSSLIHDLGRIKDEALWFFALSDASESLDLKPQTKSKRFPSAKDIQAEAIRAAQSRVRPLILERGLLIDFAQFVEIQGD